MNEIRTYQTKQYDFIPGNKHLLFGYDTANNIRAATKTFTQRNIAEKVGLSRVFKA